MKALVTGGGGFLGGAVVRALVARGDRVTTLARGDHPDLAALGVDHRRADLADADAVRRACEGQDVVFHVAARTGVWGPRADYAPTNVDGTANVLAGVRATGVPRLVYTSSPSVVFDGHDHLDADNTLPYPARHLAWYPATKAEAERAVLAAAGPALATVALRPHLIYGPGDPSLLPRVLARHRAGRLRRVGPGDNLVSLTYVDNAAAAHLQAADALTPGVPWSGRAFFVNDAEPVRLWDWLDDLFRRLGLPPCDRSVPYPVAAAGGAVAEAAWWLFGLAGEPPMTRFVAAQLASSHTYSLAPAREAFGYAPPVDAETALARTAAALAGQAP